MQDILYFAHRKAQYPSKLKTYSQHIMDIHKNISWLDYALYDMFLERHKEEVRRGGDAFQREVVVFRDILNTTSEFCHEVWSELSRKQNNTTFAAVTAAKRTLDIKSGEFNAPFKVTGAQCLVFQLHDMFIEEIVRLWMYPEICNLHNKPAYATYGGWTHRYICSKAPKAIYNIPANITSWYRGSTESFQP